VPIKKKKRIRKRSSIDRLHVKPSHISQGGVDEKKKKGAKVERIGSSHAIWGKEHHKTTSPGGKNVPVSKRAEDKKIQKKNKQGG